MYLSKSDTQTEWNIKQLFTLLNRSGTLLLYIRYRQTLFPARMYHTLFVTHRRLS